MLSSKILQSFYEYKIILFSNRPIKLAGLRLIAARLEAELIETDCMLGIMLEACILKVAKNVW